MDPKRQTVFVPIAGGLGTDTDPRMRAPERLEVAQNVRCPEIGTLGKRYGFTSLGNLIAGGGGATIADQGNLSGLGRTSKELLAAGERSLFAYVPTLGGWMERGAISPFVGTTRETFRANVQYEQADMDETATYCVYAAIRREDWGDADSRRSIELRGKDTSGDTTFAPTVVERTIVTGAGSYPYAVKVAATHGAGSGHVIVWAHANAAQVAAGGPGTLERYTYSTATPYTAPAPLTPSATEPITTDLDINSFARMFDVCTISTGGYYLVFIDDTTRSINMRKYSASHALQYSGSIAGDFYRVAICESSDHHLYILTVADNGEGGDDVILYHRNTDLSAIWGPITLETLGALPKETADNLGVCEGNNGSSLRAQCVWGVQEPAAATSEMHSRSTDPNGGSLDTLITSYNLIPYSDPFFYNKRAYVHAGTWTKTPADGIGFESHILFDLDCTSTRTSDSVAMAALWGVGQAPGLTTGYSIGSNNNVATYSDGTYLHHPMMCPFLAEAIKATAVGGLASADVRHAYDEVSFSPQGCTMITPVHRGAAVIGGGFVAWYDGSETFELGFAKPPLVYATAQSGGAGTVPAGTYTYSNLWQHVDAAGILHRSLPSPGKQEELSELKNVTLTAQSLPGSRHPYADMTCEWYRAGTDNIARRINRSAENIPNTFSAATLQTLTDVYTDAQLYVTQYTVGGVLEAVAPEGARIPYVARERLWLGDFFRGDRIQYSKLVTPSAAGETAIAPELYEALGRISDGGERITGISELDSATVIFTTNHIYLVAGYGPDNRGTSDDTSRLTAIPTDAGCIEPRSVVRGPDGVFFQTDRGIYLLDRGHNVTPIGEPVRDLMDTYSVINSAVLVTSERQVRFTAKKASGLGGRILVYDYRIGAWFEWIVHTNAGAEVTPTGATFVDGTYYVCDNLNRVWYEDTTTYRDDATGWVTMKVETGAIQPAGPLQWLGAWEIGVMAEYKDDHQIQVDVYNDHGTTATTTKTWTDAQLQALNDEANRMHLLVKPDYPKCEAIRVRLSDAASGTPTNGRGFEIHGVAVELSLYGGLPRLQAEAKN